MIAANQTTGTLLAEQATEMLERRRAFLIEWAKTFGYELPPPAGEWEQLREYEQRNAENIERADLMSEVNRILGNHA